MKTYKDKIKIDLYVWHYFFNDYFQMQKFLSRNKRKFWNMRKIDDYCLECSEFKKLEFVKLEN